MFSYGGDNMRLEYFCTMAEIKALLLFGVSMVILSYGLGWL